ncbi:hypothetical protein [Pseudoalteromonas neustonica]|uniref:hypothetical protein n=1 Tax=Pseudoalteromonas neustonica TaxID=1840331 RepID=UPI0007DB1FBB|nr:hypothetical protein [Pseudoalteromonas neustonica]
MEIQNKTPANIQELVKNANCKYDWKKRLSALQALKHFKCQQSIDVITRLALHDKVFKVKEEAFKVAQSFGIEKKGRPLSLGKKNIGYESKDFTKIFLRIKKDKKMDDLDFSLFKETFLILNPEMYDVMLYEQGKKFDSWIAKLYQTLPKK